MRVQRGHKGTHYIVQFKTMGRKHMRAHGAVADLQHMIGRPYGLDGVIIGVVDLGRPVKDNEPPTYRANKPVATRKVDSLPSCVKRLTSPDVEVRPPPLKKVKQVGYQPCHGAAVARGEATELTYEERKANAGKFRPAAEYPQQSSVTGARFTMNELMVMRELYRDHAWLRFQEWPEPVVKKVYHNHSAYEFEIFEDCMDNKLLRHFPCMVRGKDRPKPIIYPKGLADPKMLTPARIEREEVDILTRVRQILGKV